MDLLVDEIGLKNPLGEVKGPEGECQLLGERLGLKRASAHVRS